MVVEEVHPAVISIRRAQMSRKVLREKTAGNFFNAFYGVANHVIE